MGISPYNSSSAIPVMKILVALGIVIVTLGLALLANELIGMHSPSWYLQLAAVGAIILVMSYLSIMIFRGLEYV